MPAGQDVTKQFVHAPQPISVTSLVASIKEALLDNLPARQAVVGEISNFRRHSSGHFYFCLKDADSAIDAVMFRPDAASVRFEPQDGLEVVAEGRVDIYERSGRLQFYVSRLAPRGTGALELAFRQLKEKLQKEGLFDTTHKLALPRYPRSIGVITSPTGAAIRDIYRALCRRWPCARMYLLPARVQGEGAAKEIAEAIEAMDRQAAELEIDTIIIGRGGGSLEDLWAFNEEAVARAVYACRTPIVCGVGHETDFTIADFVADVRAATPTAAAELATPDKANVARACDAMQHRLSRRLAEHLATGRQDLVSVQRSSVFRDPLMRVRSGHQRVDELSTRLQHRLVARCRTGEQRLHEAERVLAGLHPRQLVERAGNRLSAVRRDLAWALGHKAKLCGDLLAKVVGKLSSMGPMGRVKLGQARLDGLAGRLEALSYRSALRRGFSVTRKDGHILRSREQIGPGDVLETELADGKVQSVVDGAAARPRRRTKQEEQGPSLFSKEEP